MLQSLKIENIAIIESAGLELSRGFNVLTGETGAGKSIIIDSINAVLGERTSREIVRTGANEARVSALFSNVSAGVRAVLESFDIDDSDELLIQRKISADGKNVCRVNGSPVTVSMLKAIGRELVNIHGQHDSQALLSPESHCGYIDRLAGDEALLAEYKEKYLQLNSLKKELSSLSMDEAEKARRTEMLSFQIDELTFADIRVGERDELNSKKLLYRNLEKVMLSLRNAYELLFGDESGESGASSRAEDAACCVEQAQEYFEELKGVSEWLHGAAFEMEEYASQIIDLLSGLEINPAEMEAVEERLDTLYRLSRKYGATEQDMLDFLEKAQNEMESITLSDEKILLLQSEIARCSAQLTEMAHNISSVRKAARDFENRVCGELDFIDMPGVSFVVNFKETVPTGNGIDDVEFLISANAGEAPKPMAKIASGGELSRIMLAIKSVLAGDDNIDTLIFDEIDTGVSGRAAQKVALKMKEVSRGRQVICVTHLSQIAATADAHLLISKSSKDGKTYTRIEKLDFEGRKREIARINGGMDVTELQLQNAEEMLKSALIKE